MEVYIYGYPNGPLIHEAIFDPEQITVEIAENISSDLSGRHVTVVTLDQHEVAQGELALIRPNLYQVLKH